MTFLVVGVDAQTHARWHGHVLARDLRTAARIARTRAGAQGITLVIAAVIGPNSSVLSSA